MRQRLEFPFGGRSDENALTDQKHGTTRRCKNVVPHFPLTGRMQGGQRSGIAPFMGDGNQPLAGEGQPVQALLGLNYDSPAYDFAQLGNPAVGGANAAVTDEWGLSGTAKDTAVHVVVNSQRDAFFLTSSGYIEKVNSSGKRVFTLQVPLAPGQEAVRRIALDLDGFLYAASASPQAGILGRVWRWEPREDDTGMDLAWEDENGISGYLLPVSDVVDLAIHRGGLYVAANHQNEAFVLALSSLDASQPTLDWQESAPYPIRSIASGPRGLYGTSPPNDDRGAQPVGEGFVAGDIQWSPAVAASLTNNTQRVHAWLDATTLTGFPEGGRVNFMPDARFEEFVPTDDTDRGFQAASVWNPAEQTGPRPPRYIAQAAGPLPGLLFRPEESSPLTAPEIDYDHGNALWTRRGPVNAGPILEDKVNASAGKLPRSTGLWPLSESHNFSVHWLIRWRPNYRPSVLWQVGAFDEYNQEPSPFGLAITVNDSGATTNEWDHLQLPGPDGQHPHFQPGGIALRGTCTSATVQGSAAAVAGSEVHMALISLYVEKGTANSRLRVNGADAGTCTINDSTLSSVMESLGSRIYWERDKDTDWYLPGLYSFKGVVCEALTVHTDTTTTAHDGTYSWSGAGGNATTNDVHRIEGYLAHKWGVSQQVLAASHPFQANPPTAGGAYVPAGEDATSVALRSHYGIGYKFSPTGAIQWAIDGSGLGYGVVADRKTEDAARVLFYGPRITTALGAPSTEVGPQSRTLRAVLDRGLSVDEKGYCFGEITIDAALTDGDTITLSDGTTSSTFEIDTVPDGVGGGNIVVDTSGGPTDAQTIAVAIEQAVTAAVGSGGCDIYAERDQRTDEFPQTIRFWNRLSSAAISAVAITESTSGARMTVVSGMSARAATPTGTWDLKEESAQSPQNQYPRMDADFEGDFWVPRENTTKQNHVVKYQGDTGTELITHEVTGSPEAFGVKAVFCDPIEGKLFGTAIRGDEFLWVANDNIEAGDVTPDRPTQSKLRLVSRTPNNQTATAHVNLALAGGNVYKIPRGGTPAPVASSVTTANSQWPLFIPAFGKAYLIDNGTYKVYDPLNDALETWEAKGSGRIPEGCRLGAFYHQRMVLARSPDDPTHIHASALGDPEDWDTSKPLDVFARAFSGANLEYARNPDIVNALLPFYDDVLLVGGDRSLTQVTGDLGESGRIHLLTNSLGVAYGPRSMAIMPGGHVAFFGIPGGVYVVSPSSFGRAVRPLEITNDVERSMRSVNTSTHWPWLVWNNDEKGLHVFFVARGTATPDPTIEHWFWDERTKGWFPYVIGDASRLPYCAEVFDAAGPDDRVMALGCQDGRVRFWSKSARSDDGFRIDSNVLIGPLVHQDFEYEQTISFIESTLSKAHAGVRYRIYAADNPEDLGEPVEEGDLYPGFSGRVYAHARGGALWLELGNAGLFETWALKSLYAHLSAAGARRSG